MRRVRLTLKPGQPGTKTKRTIVAVRVDWQELEIRQKVKAAGGKWDPAARVWRLSRERVESLDLGDRVVEGAM